MEFERGIWAEALRNAKKNFYLIAIIIVLAVALSFAQEIWKLGTAGNVGFAFAWLQLAITAHITILNSQPDIRIDQKTNFLGKFFGTSFVLNIGPLAISIIAFALFYDRGEGLAFFSAIFVYSILELLVLAKWGTRYPAIVVGSDRSFGKAGIRGKQTFGYVFWRLLICNGPILFISFLLLLTAITMNDNQDKIWDTVHGLNPTILLAEIIFNGAFAFQIVLLATILSRAYLIAEAKMKEAPIEASAP